MTVQNKEPGSAEAFAVQLALEHADRQTDWCDASKILAAEVRRLRAAHLAPQAEPVAWRYLKHLCGPAFAWTRWLDMDELHHYDENGNLVKGPCPTWRVEYAYLRPQPPLPQADWKCPVFEANTCQTSPCSCWSPQAEEPNK